MEPSSRCQLVYSDMAGLKTQMMRVELFIIKMGFVINGRREMETRSPDKLSGGVN